MTLHFTILEKDYLEHQLYVSSQNPRTQKNRFRARILLPIVAALATPLMLILAEYKLAITYALLGPLWYWLYGYYQQWFYHRHFARYVKENLADQFGLPVRVEITDDRSIQATDAGSETKILLSEIKSMTEIPNLILLRFKGGSTLILPKARIAECDALRIRLKEIATSLEITYDVAENWKWK
jgi:hypothetical protein